MKEIETQMRLEDISQEYKDFIEKFKLKKTTDDCYTPANVYDAVLGWVCREYSVDPDNVVRPFWPGGDYERFPYEETDVVVDNPPFSIVSKIVAYYNIREIPYFLFAPYLTNLGVGGAEMNTSHIITSTGITYENGADVPTAFLTNMDGYFVRSCPDLCQLIEAENNKNLAAVRKQVPKYVYPDYVLTAGDLGYMAKHGIDFRLKKESCFFIRGLDSQRGKGKTIFGSGFLLSEKAAAEKAAAEKAAAEKAAAEKWELSEREWNIIKSLEGEKP